MTNNKQLNVSDIKTGQTVWIDYNISRGAIVEYVYSGPAKVLQIYDVLVFLEFPTEVLVSHPKKKIYDKKAWANINDVKYIIADNCG